MCCGFRIFGCKEVLDCCHGAEREHSAALAWQRDVTTEHPHGDAVPYTRHEISLVTNGSRTAHPHCDAMQHKRHDVSPVSDSPAISPAIAPASAPAIGPT